MIAFTTKKAFAKDQLLQAIRAGRYRPGEQLRQNDIARDLGLSSTPVREALTDLAGSGLVTYEQHRGVRVAELQPDRVRQVYHARKVIELEAARLAFAAADAALVRRLSALVEEMAEYRRQGRTEQLMAADEAFHLALLSAGGNPYLVAAARQLWDSFPRYFIWLSADRMDQSADEHRRMVATLAAGDEAAFLALAGEHLDNSSAALLAYLDAAAAADTDTDTEPEGKTDEH